MTGKMKLNADAEAEVKRLAHESLRLDGGMTAAEAIRSAMLWAYADAARWTIDAGWVGEGYSTAYHAAVEERANAQTIVEAATTIRRALEKSGKDAERYRWLRDRRRPRGRGRVR